MKKAILLVLVAVAAIFTTTKLVTADEAGTAQLVVHYQNWNNEYDELGAWTWVEGGADTPVEPSKIDEFGAVFEVTAASKKGIEATQEVGFIAVKFAEGAPDWSSDANKQTQNVVIQGSDLKAGEENHVYIFEGAATTEDTPSYLVKDNSKANMIIMYADPSGNYEENLGVHIWGGWTVAEPEWNKPLDIFINGASHSAIPEIKIGLMTAPLDKKDAGLLIYYGDGDNSKKTGDVKISDALNLKDDQELKAGDIGFAYVYSTGTPNYTANDNVSYGKNETFVENAFPFVLKPMQVTASGQFKGTYAPRPNQVIVELSQAIYSPLYKKVTEKDKIVDVKIDEKDQPAALDIVKSWFTVTDKSGKEFAVKNVDFSQVDATVREFVVVLENEKVFDITNEYTITFDLGLEENNKTADIIIDMDKEKPKLTFISPSGFAIAKPEDRVIQVPWNKKFDLALFPTYIVKDNRDGEITSAVYVPKGDKSTINTNILGDYEIELRVEDSWGNVTSETFIFRVVKKVK